MKIKNRIIPVLTFTLLLFIVYPLKSQRGIELGVSIGSAAYQGDLAPSSLRGAIGDIGLYTGVYTIIRPISFTEIEVFANIGSLSADDKNQLAEGRKSRNLHFKSRIIDYGARINLLLPIYWSNRKNILSPYIGLGLTRVHFNPKAKYQNQWIALRDIGTEGQGLARYPNKSKYALTAIGPSFLAGIRYARYTGWTIRLEGGIRSTDTDYLDDVSGTYPDLNYLQELSGDLAYALSYRGTAQAPIEGQSRGNPLENDWYIVLQLKIGYTITFAAISDKRKRARVLCPKL